MKRVWMTEGGGCLRGSLTDERGRASRHRHQAAATAAMMVLLITTRPTVVRR